MDIVRKILALLSPKERRQAYVLLGMILIMAFLDVVGIASIMPFMAVLANPEIIQTNRWLQAAFINLGFNDAALFLSFLGAIVFMALLVSIAFKAATTWAITHFTQMRNYSIARRLLCGYLHQPYEWFLNRHSADLGKSILSEVQLVISGALVPLLRLLAQGTLVIAILLLLVFVDPMLAFIVGGGIGGSYGMLYMALRRYLGRIGGERLAANELRFKVIGEAFGGIKELKLGGLEKGALERFDRPAKRFAQTQVTARIAALMPRYILEAVAFGGILLLVLILMRRTEGLPGALPILAVYALAGYRLMPALQMAYDQATNLRFSGPALERLHRDLTESASFSITAPNTEGPLIPKHVICFEGVSYSYPNADRPAVDALNLEINVQSTVGFVGATGSGKTTTIDLLLGLLTPHEGELSVDGIPVSSENQRAWQNSLGYVPQQIFLLDETVAANIAFGIPGQQIDFRAVEQAATVANLHQFIVDELPQGYETLVGERGVRLSGGQRQRIGIARALYRQPSVLVLDEATSALDNLTEQAVMEAVHSLSGEKTIILIAHRLTTVRDCDCIYLLDHGKLIGQGTYDELTRMNPQFRAMAGV